MNYLASLNGVLNHPLNINNKARTLLRIFLWKINQFSIKKPLIVEMEKGVKCICYPDSSFGSLIVYTRIPDYEEVQFIMKILRDRDTFVDVGAGIGDYSLIAAGKIKKGKVYAFEPVDSSLKNFRENIRINEFQDRIKVFENVVSEKTGNERFVCETVSEVSSIGRKGLGKLKKAISLDNFAKVEKIKRINFLKIDVEGAEMKILRGAKGLLMAKKVDYILFEINKKSKNYGYRPDDLIRLLSGYGYNLFRFDNGLKSITQIDTNTVTFNGLAIRKDMF